MGKQRVVTSLVDKVVWTAGNGLGGSLFLCDLHAYVRDPVIDTH